CIYAIKAKQGSHRMPRVPRETVSMMVPVWKEPAENRELLDDFGIDSTQYLPMLSVFGESEDGEGTILNKNVKLVDSSVEDAFAKLREVFLIISEAAEKISAEYMNDNIRAYTAVEYALKGYNELQSVKRVAKIWKALKSYR
ncbi:MAG: hypothetical protein OEV80_17005, partial [candidate division Zixibacteria bacterium]|nr:hypothetical protein [candidate division Zixibacteria bacterium]